MPAGVPAADFNPLPEPGIHSSSRNTATRGLQQEHGYSWGRPAAARPVLARSPRERSSRCGTPCRPAARGRLARGGREDIRNPPRISTPTESAGQAESSRAGISPAGRNQPRRAGISPGGPESARRAGISQAGRNQPGWTRICQRAVISPAGPNLAGRSGIYWAGQARGKSVTFATSAFEADDRITARQAKAANPGQPFRESRTVWPGHPTATRYSVLTCAPRPEITKGGAQAQSGGRHPRRHLGSPGLAPNPASWRGQPGDPVARILAIERPSPDPPMNRRCSSLDAYCLVSNAERIQLRRRASEGTTFAAESICSG